MPNDDKMGEEGAHTKKNYVVEKREEEHETHHHRNYNIRWYIRVLLTHVCAVARLYAVVSICGLQRD